jgi:hypothetical protein
MSLASGSAGRTPAIVSSGAGDGALLDPLEDTLRLLLPISLAASEGRQASNSSTVRGQSSFSSRDSERSASTRPSVWQRGQ